MVNTKSSENQEHSEIISQLKKISTRLSKIEERLTHLEHTPLQDGARVISQGAKAFTESARDIYERVEARKWFDKSYEAASKVCDTVSEQFKSWWETRGNKAEAEKTKPMEGEVIKKRE